MDRQAKVKFKPGDLYEINFYDHCTGHDSPFNCFVVGYVLDDDDAYVKLSHWIVNTDERDVFKDNLEKVIILKSCIIKRKKLFTLQQNLFIK